MNKQLRYVELFLVFLTTGIKWHLRMKLTWLLSSDRGSLQMVNINPTSWYYKHNLEQTKSRILICNSVGFVMRMVGRGRLAMVQQNSLWNIVLAYKVWPKSSFYVLPISLLYLPTKERLCEIYRSSPISGVFGFWDTVLTGGTAL